MKTKYFNFICIIAAFISFVAIILRWGYVTSSMDGITGWISLVGLFFTVGFWITSFALDESHEVQNINK